MRAVGLILGSLLAAGPLRAQVLQGGFATYVPKRTVTFEYHFYWFENGRFIHTEHGCTGDEHGAGTYQLRGDSLWLRFDGPPALRSTVTPDSVREAPGTLSIKVLSLQTGLPLAGAQVYTWSTSVAASPLVTDIEGILNLGPLPATDNRVFIRAAGYEPVTLLLHSAHRHYTARLAPDRPRGQYDAGTTQLKLLKPGASKRNHLRWTDTERDWDVEFEALTPQKTAELRAEYEQLRAATN